MKVKKSVLLLSSLFFIFSCTNGLADNKAKEEQTINAKNAIETQNEFSRVYDHVKGSVVNIRTKKTTYVNTYNPLEEFLFGNSGGTEKRESGTLGSGFVISEDGYVMTNNHVVDGADEIFVQFEDGREFKTKLIGKSPEVDIAILKIESNEKFIPLKFADSNNIKIGQWSIAFGNPLGLNNTMTVGVVSATGRSSLGIEKIENFIQTDAAINQGNSGGPLIDIQGQVIGVNTAILSQNGGSVGLGFAIPANLANNVKDSIIKTGKFERPFLGVQLQDLTPELAKQFKLNSVNGVLIANVESNSPAQKSGLKNGDVVTKVNEKAVNSAGSLVGEIAAKKVGEAINLTIIRDGKEMILNVSLSKQAQSNSTDEQALVFSGLKIRNLTSDDLSKSGLPTNFGGVLITELTPNSNALATGLRPGMIITSLNKIDIKNVNDFKVAYDKAQRGSEMLILVLTQQGSRYTTLVKE